MFFQRVLLLLLTLFAFSSVKADNNNRNTNITAPRPTEPPFVLLVWNDLDPDVGLRQQAPNFSEEFQTRDEALANYTYYQNQEDTVHLILLRENGLIVESWNVAGIGSDFYDDDDDFANDGNNTTTETPMTTTTTTTETPTYPPYSLLVWNNVDPELDVRQQAPNFVEEFGTIEEAFRNYTLYRWSDDWYLWLVLLRDNAYVVRASFYIYDVDTGCNPIPMRNPISLQPPFRVIVWDNLDTSLPFWQNDQKYSQVFQTLEEAREYFHCMTGWIRQDDYMVLIRGNGLLVDSRNRRLDWMLGSNFYDYFADDGNVTTTETPTTTTETPTTTTETPTTTTTTETTTTTTETTTTTTETPSSPMSDVPENTTIVGGDDVRDASTSTHPQGDSSHHQSVVLWTVVTCLLIGTIAIMYYRRKLNYEVSITPDISNV